jgi:cytidylate kinase
MKKGFVIAIDGPVASGKGTIAHTLAQRIHALNINTGGIWRAYTYVLVKRGEFPSREVLEYLKKLNVTLNIRDDGSFDVLLNDENITDQLNDPDISKAVSKFGTNNEFAEFIIAESRRIACEYLEQGKSVIMEGRQIGTVVFPDADLKIFLTANLDVRAKRRQEQYEKKGIVKPIEDVVQETHDRDEQDMNREVGPLPRNPEKLGYVIVDNSALTEEKTLDDILDLIKERKIWQQN